MRAKRYARTLTEEEKSALDAGLKSQDVFVLRRCQILLFSSEGFASDEIAVKIDYSHENVRLVLKRFEEEGLKVLEKGKRGPRNREKSISEENAEKLRDLLRHSPRDSDSPSHVAA